MVSARLDGKNVYLEDFDPETTTAQEIHVALKAADSGRGRLTELEFWEGSFSGEAVGASEVAVHGRDFFFPLSDVESMNIGWGGDASWSERFLERQKKCLQAGIRMTSSEAGRRPHVFFPEKLIGSDAFSLAAELVAVATQCSPHGYAGYSFEADDQSYRAAAGDRDDMLAEFKLAAAARVVSPPPASGAVSAFSTPEPA